MTTSNKPTNTTTDKNKWSNTGSTPNQQPGKGTPGDTRKQSTTGTEWSQKDQWQKGPASPAKGEKGWDVRAANEKTGKGTNKNNKIS